jgi:hydroxyacylglutathione hydrolase
MCQSGSSFLKGFTKEQEMRSLVVQNTLLSVLFCLCGLTASAQVEQPEQTKIEAGMLPRQWVPAGPKCMEVPEWQVQEYNENLYLLRQSGCTDYEKPFIFLFFGKERAMLLDTGSRHGNLAPELHRVVKNWLSREKRTSIPLIVVHTHSHSDHIAGDAEVQAIKDPAMPVTFVPAELEATKKLYGIQHWPEDIGKIDLGNRVLDVIPIPGHNAVGVAIYDRNTAILFTGDSLYPGRLYVEDFNAFQASTERMIRFTQGKPVAHILGNHIEQTRTPFIDYPVGTIYQPQEHQLDLSRGSLLELEDGLLSLHGKPARLALRDLTIWPVGSDFPVSAAEKAAYTQRQREQNTQMWNQSPQ